MRRALLAILVLMFVLGLAGTALAATPTVIGADGSSAFTYQDLQDAFAKPEGGYAAFETSFTAGSYWNGSALTSGTALDGEGYKTSPHGGYAANTNKCKVCHAVHRAEGAYYLLRADSQSDACDYCHVGGSAHSAKIVYDLNGAGTATTNGHTLGAGQVPDSSVKQTATPVVISGTDVNGLPVSETVNVRSYDPAGIGLYRFSRHHSQSPVSIGRSGFKPVGPNSLSCFSCHQPHNALAQVWQPSKFDATLVADTVGGNNTTGYKLLRRYPSGGWVGLDGNLNGTTNTYGMVDSTKAIKVPETTLTAGVNYSQSASFDGLYFENGITSTRPVWIAQNMSAEYAGTGPAEDPATVNEYALSAWCADCHNLNIGASEALTNEELGFKAHTERTHAAPYVGAHGGPGQCYSCHRNDLSVMPGKADPVGYGMNQTNIAQNTLVGRVTGASNSCGQCHYGTGAYYVDQNFGRESDFPHSGRSTDIKLLGSYTASVATGTSYTPVFSQATITEDNLDAVCIRCHPGIGVHN